MTQRKFEARYSDGLLEPVDALPLGQGQRVLITVEPCEPPPGVDAAQEQKRFNALAGAWQRARVDAEEIKREIHEAKRRPAKDHSN